MMVKVTLATPEVAISDNAKMCYANSGSKDITSSLVHSHKHLAVLRFAYMTVEITGISTACQNQLVRSKHLNFLVQSKRYVSADKGNFNFIMPKFLGKAQEKVMSDFWKNSLATYNMLLEQGVKKEDARAVLLMNTSTAMNVTGNLQAWMDFYRLRLTKHAQQEIRELAKEIYRLSMESFPQVFTKELFKELSGEECDYV